MKRAKHGSGLMARKFVKALGFGAALAASLALAPIAFAKDWKTVVIGMEGAYEPWNLTDSSGKIVGFEVDLANDLCKRAGLECKVIAQDWDGMIPGLKAGQFDVIMDGMSITDERKKEIDFSKPYAASPGSFLAPKDSPLAKATAAGTLVNLDKDIATVKEYKTTDDRDLDLKSGRIDASLDDLPTNIATASKPDASELAVVGPKLIGGVFGTGEGMGIRKSDADLTAKFDTALTEAIADGTVKKISEQWFKIDM